MRRPHHKVNFEDINRGHQNYLEYPRKCAQELLMTFVETLKWTSLPFKFLMLSIAFAQNKGQNKLNWIELILGVFSNEKKRLTTRLYWKHRLTNCIVTPKHQLRCNHIDLSVKKGIAKYDRWPLQQELKFALPQIAYMLSVRFRSHWASAMQSDRFSPRLGVNGPLDLNPIMVNIKVKQLKNKRIKCMLYLKFTKYIKKIISDYITIIELWKFKAGLWQKLWIKIAMWRSRSSQIAGSSRYATQQLLLCNNATFDDINLQH